MNKETVPQTLYLSSGKKDVSAEEASGRGDERGGGVCANVGRTPHRETSYTPPSVKSGISGCLTTKPFVRVQSCTVDEISEEATGRMSRTAQHAHCTVWYRNQLLAEYTAVGSEDITAWRTLFRTNPTTDLGVLSIEISQGGVFLPREPLAI